MGKKKKGKRKAGRGADASSLAQPNLEQRAVALVGEAVAEVVGHVVNELVDYAATQYGRIRERGRSRRERTERRGRDPRLHGAEAP